MTEVQMSTYCSHYLLSLRHSGKVVTSAGNLSDSDHDDDTTNVGGDCRLAKLIEFEDYLASHFRLPLEAKGVSLATVQDKVEKAVECV